MLVAKFHMWPLGNEGQARFLGAAALDCIGRSGGERRYRVRLLKMPEFKGPEEHELREALTRGLKKHIWREGFVRGHRPGPRGTWDLLGGSLRELLSERLASYRAFDPEEPQLEGPRQHIDASIGFSPEEIVVLRTRLRDGLEICAGTGNMSSQLARVLRVALAALDEIDRLNQELDTCRS